MAIHNPDNSNSGPLNALLSIIIPVYNVEQYLAQCLESVREQDQNRLQVILVNDSSTDNSAAIAAKYAQENDNWCLISHTTNQGLGQARNSALDCASSRYVMFLDSDDWLVQGAIDEILAAISNSSACSPDFIQFGCNKLHEDASGKITRTEMNLYCLDAAKKPSLHEKQKLALSIPSYACLKVVKRKFIESNHLRFESIFYEDIPWSFSLIIKAKQIDFVPRSIINYRQRNDSITFSKSARHLDLLSAYQRMFETLAGHSSGKVLKQAMADSFITAAYYLYKHKDRRLDQQGYETFKRRYKGILWKQKLFPRRFRTLAMMLITLLNL